MDVQHSSIAELRQELAALEDEAAGLSRLRSHLQHQIDFGFETATTRDREREVSAERNELHRRIDSLKETIRARESA
jgi:chromosome segregation ATPase